MRFICLGYFNEQEMAKMPKSQQEAMMEECLAYDDVLRQGGHIASGEALQSSRTAKTLRLANGKMMVTDGPFAETKEQLGGLLVFEARDMDHAVQLMSKHPGTRFGPFEIRAVDEQVNALVEARNKRAVNSV
jgi:hypothetical protein